MRLRTLTMARDHNLSTIYCTMGGDMGNIEMTTDHSLVLNKVSIEATWCDDLPSVYVPYLELELLAV